MILIHFNLVDICYINNGGCQHECTHTEDGAALCTCPEGFKLTPDGKNCEGLYNHKYF